MNPHHLDHPLLTHSLRSGIKFGLHTIQTVLHAFGSPQKKYPSIHITGTNGKGSTSRLLSASLQALGFKTGLFTSPHIQTLNERFQVNHQNIPDETLKKILDRIQAVCAELIQSQQIETITFFEACTAAAFLYFAEQKVDVAVVEVGLGGRLDSTNVIHSPWVILTTIGLDHEEYLGSTLAQVALEKAGIIHGNAQVILGLLPEDITPLVRQSKPEAFFHLSGEHFSVQSQKQALNTHLIYQSDGPLNGFDFSLSLPGLFQRQNVALSLRALELFCPERLEGYWGKLREAFRQVVWKGRMHRISQSPLLIFDSAHNPHGVAALVDSLKILHPGTSFSVICGFCKDKDYPRMISGLSEVCDDIRIVPLDVERGALPTVIVKEIASSVRASESFEAAMQEIRRETPDKPILVCGSFYLLEKAYAWLEKN